MIEKHLPSILAYDSIASIEVIQELWSGYGVLCRVNLNGSEHKSVIVKQIDLEGVKNHPRSWNNNFAHQRKVRSYEVEFHFYQNYSSRVGDSKVPKLIVTKELEGMQYLVLEDLALLNFKPKSNPSEKDINHCVRWLAHFHAKFLGVKPDGLWEEGTYWHLDTRPDEWQAMEENELKNKASIIANKLNQAKYQTFVHGDAKYANFCFAEESVAAVDFQYVGGGCGMKDLIYLMSCDSAITAEKADKLLNYYFEQFHVYRGELNTALEQEWRNLYAFAWADFERFLLGWAPGHWKVNDYTKSQVEIALVTI